MRYNQSARFYRRMFHTATELFNNLKSSEPVLLKGDFYRKLTNDAAWDPTAPFYDRY